MAEDSIYRYRAGKAKHYFMDENEESPLAFHLVQPKLG